MKRILFIAALALSFSACDNTKLQLRAAGSDQANATAGTVIQKSDSVVSDTIKKDTLRVH